MDQHSDPQYKTEDGSALRIWKDTAQNNFLSEREGRPIFDEVVYVEVISPGSASSTPIFEAIRVLAKEANAKEPLYRTKYPEFKKYIDDFEAGEQHDATLSGTPLSQWPEISRSLAATLKAQKIFTVDALANLPDERLVAVGPDGRTWREKAIAYIENAKNSSYATALAADLARAHEREDDLREQVKMLADRVQAMQDAAAKDNDAKQPGTESKLPPPLDQKALQPII